MFAKFLFRHEDDDLSGGEVSHLYSLFVFYKNLFREVNFVFLEGRMLL